MVEEAALDLRDADEVQPVERAARLEVAQERERAVEHADVAIGDDDDGAVAVAHHDGDGVALVTAGGIGHGAFEFDERFDAEQAIEAGGECGASGRERGRVDAGWCGEDDATERVGVSGAERAVGDAIVAEPKPVAVLGAQGQRRAEQQGNAERAGEEKLGEGKKPAVIHQRAD